MDIQRTAVLGSGVMGAAIAAHLANCGVPSLLLDMLPNDLSDAEKNDPKKRNRIADANRSALLKAKPSPLYLKSMLDLIETGNFEDDLPRIEDCDWIIEVIVENLDVKKTLFERVAKHRRPGTIVTTNTSGIPIAKIAEGMDEEMGRHFFGTHFFNPPRYLKLLELIPGPDTLPEVIEKMADFGENVLGKGIVYAKDTPNFIANRLLTFAMQFILYEFTKAGLTIEEVDALTGPAVGHASSATFRTADLVGLDTYRRVVENTYEACPDDERRELMKAPEWVAKMIEQGYLGAKSGSGFYRKTEHRDEKGKRIIQAIDPETLAYREPEKVRLDCTGAARKLDDLEDKIRVMHNSEDKGSKFVFKLFANSAQYAGNRIPEIADDIVNIDNAVKWGFAWERGIFETWDILGFDEVCARMEAAGIALPEIAKQLRAAGGNAFYKRQNGRLSYFDLASKSYKPVPANPNEIRLAHVKTQASRLVKKNDAADLIDLGDDILCAAFHTKLNVIDAEMMRMLNTAVDLLDEDKFRGLIIANQGPHFCAGANLFMILGEIMQQNWDGVAMAVETLQTLNMRMKYCDKPVVAAPHHYTFGGAVELCQHADRCVIAGETYAGLVEAGVGIVPAGGGTKEMLLRALEFVPDNVEADPFPFVRRAFENIAMAKVSTSGAEFIELGYLRASDIVVTNFEQQVKKAKDHCLGLSIGGYQPPRPPRLRALGDPVEATLRIAIWGMQQAGWASEHDALIAGKVAHILCGGDRWPGAPMTEQDLLDLEREAFCSLCGTEKTQQRMQHILANGKPLRN